MTITKLVIDRAKWGVGCLLRGPNNLLNHDPAGWGPLREPGKMCCLGFLAKACGIPDEKLVDLGFPEASWSAVPVPFRKLNDYDTVIAQQHPMYKATTINDSEYPQEEKEKMLTELFAKEGIELSFEGVARE